MRIFTKYTHIFTKLDKNLHQAQQNAMYTVVVRAHVGRLDADAMGVTRGCKNIDKPRNGVNIVSRCLRKLLEITQLLFDAIKLSRVLTEDETVWLERKPWELEQVAFWGNRNGRQFLKDFFYISVKKNKINVMKYCVMYKLVLKTLFFKFKLPIEYSYIGTYLQNVKTYNLQEFEREMEKTATPKFMILTLKNNRKSYKTFNNY